MVFNLSYVSIWKPVDGRTVEASLWTDNDIIKPNLDRLEDYKIIIEGSINGKSSEIMTT